MEVEIPDSSVVFDRDPFLLKIENQLEYGRSILHNLLMKRAILIAEAGLIDLNASAPVTKMNKPVSEPSDELKAKYNESRIKRLPIDDEKERLQLMRITMMARGELTARRLYRVEARKKIDAASKDKKKPKKAKKVPKFATHDIAEKALANSQSPLSKRIRIAAIGFRVKISKLDGTGYLNEELCRSPADGSEVDQLGRTMMMPSAHGAQSSKWTDTICSHIRTAIGRGSQFILAPEFGLPPAEADQDILTKIQSCCESAGRNTGQNHFIFAGSRHEGYHNKGLVVQLERGTVTHKPAKTDSHYKVASARSLGENILGPRSSIYKTYETPVIFDDKPYPFDTTVAICYDTFDPSTFLWLVLGGMARRTDRRARQVILVPSFNPSPFFVEQLRDLSFLTASVVVYLNGLHGDARMFVSGFSIRDLLDHGSKRSALKSIERYSAWLQRTGFLKQKSETIWQARSTKRSRQLNREKTKLGKLEEHLNVLKYQFEGLQLRRSLQHLITVEPCVLCKKGKHRDDYGCNSDILYYNIDPYLLDALTQFSKNYFSVDDSFLPEPFQQEYLGDYLLQWRKRSEERRKRDNY